jgi:hypothetical protein
MNRSAWVIGLAVVVHASAQTVPFEAHYQFGGLVPFANRWEGPWSLDLVSTPGGRTGKVWLRETPDGLLIFARFAGGPPKYARFPAEMGQRDYVGVWLSASPGVEMPAVGWGNGGCRGVSPSHDAGEECDDLEARQTRYREQLQRLFARHWKLTPAATFEDYASSAYRDVLAYVPNGVQTTFVKLEPSGGPRFQAADSTGFSYFEVFVKWSDFPPANTLNLSKIYFALDLCGQDGAGGSTSPGGKEGDPPTFREFPLERPLIANVSPCNFPLTVDAAGNSHPGWYFPTADGHVNDVFTLQSSFRDYPHIPWGLSPVPTWTHYFSKSVSKREVVCGPDLRYAVDGKVAAFKGTLDADHLSVRANADGTHLLMTGPTVGPYGLKGQCGSCPNVDFTIYHLSPANGVSIDFQTSFRLDIPGPTDGDIRVSSDWRTVTVYKLMDPARDPSGWSSERYCLSGTTYEDCGPGPSTAPPNPRIVKWPNQ